MLTFSIFRLLTAEFTLWNLFDDVLALERTNARSAAEYFNISSFNIIVNSNNSSLTVETESGSRLWESMYSLCFLDRLTLIKVVI